jgi:two-component system chemotaxis response regulator CheY
MGGRQNGGRFIHGFRIMTFPAHTPVLIVEDFKTMRRIQRNFLERLGYGDVDEAADGAAALELIAARDYGLVISDWNMAPMTGFELLKRVRASGRNADVPFLMVTAESGVASVAAAQAAGVSDYLVKPYRQEALQEKLDAIFARAAAG